MSIQRFIEDLGDAEKRIRNAISSELTELKHNHPLIIITHVSVNLDRVQTIGQPAETVIDKVNLLFEIRR